MILRPAIKQQSKSHFRDIVPPYIPEVVSIRCGFSKTKELLES
jgi:hypothetical protein